MPDIPSTASRRPEPPPIVLDYAGPSTAPDTRRPPAGNLHFALQMLLGFFSVPIWWIATALIGNLLNLQGGGLGSLTPSSEFLPIFYLLAAGIYLALLILGRIKLRWRGLIPGALLFIFGIPLVILGICFLSSR